MVNSPTLSAIEGARRIAAREWIQVVRGRAVMIFAVTLLGAGSAAFWFAQQPKVYESSTTIEYDVSSGHAVDQSAGNDSQSELSHLASRELIRTQNYILTSRALAERVVRKLALDKKTTAGNPVPRNHNARMQSAVEQLQASLNVVPIAGTRAVEFRVRAATPDQAALIANTLVDCYLEKSLEDRASASSLALRWLREQQTDLRRQVEASEHAVLEFREEHQALSASLEQRRRVISGQFASYNDALTGLRIKRVQAEARLTVLKEAMGAQPNPLTVQAGAIGQDSAMAELRERYRNTQVLLKQLAITHGPESPQLIAAQAEMDAIQIQLASQLELILKGAQADLKEVERAEVGLKRALSELHEQSVALSREELEFASLERDRASQNERYEVVLERTAKADLARMLGASTARVIDRAVPAAAAVPPRFELAVGVGGILGLALGILLAVGWERRNARRTLLEGRKP